MSVVSSIQDEAESRDSAYHRNRESASENVSMVWSDVLINTVSQFYVFHKIGRFAKYNRGQVFEKAEKGEL